MITGTVEDLEARIRIKVRGKGEREKEIVALIDTGYSGFL
jgi:predicted aspartyl protease